MSAKKGAKVAAGTSSSSPGKSADSGGGRGSGNSNGSERSGSNTGSGGNGGNGGATGTGGNGMNGSGRGEGEKRERGNDPASASGSGSGGSGSGTTGSGHESAGAGSSGNGGNGGNGGSEGSNATSSTSGTTSGSTGSKGGTRGAALWSGSERAQFLSALSSLPETFSWPEMAGAVPTRTDKQVKEYYYRSMRKLNGILAEHKRTIDPNDRCKAVEAVKKFLYIQKRVGDASRRRESTQDGEIVMLSKEENDQVQKLVVDAFVLGREPKLPRRGRKKSHAAVAAATTTAAPGKDEDGGGSDEAGDASNVNGGSGGGSGDGDGNGGVGKDGGDGGGGASSGGNGGTTGEGDATIVVRPPRPTSRRQRSALLTKKESRGAGVFGEDVGTVRGRMPTALGGTAEPKERIDSREAGVILEWLHPRLPATTYALVREQLSLLYYAQDNSEERKNSLAVAAATTTSLEDKEKKGSNSANANTNANTNTNANANGGPHHASSTTLTPAPNAPVSGRGDVGEGSTAMPPPRAPAASKSSNSKVGASSKASPRLVTDMAVRMMPGSQEIEDLFVQADVNPRLEIKTHKGMVVSRLIEHISRKWGHVFGDRGSVMIFPENDKNHPGWHRGHKSAALKDVFGDLAAPGAVLVLLYDLPQFRRSADPDSTTLPETGRSGKKRGAGASNMLEGGSGSGSAKAGKRRRITPTFVGASASTPPASAMAVTGVLSPTSSFLSAASGDGVPSPALIPPTPPPSATGGLGQIPEQSRDGFSAAIAGSGLPPPVPPHVPSTEQLSDVLAQLAGAPMSNTTFASVLPPPPQPAKKREEAQSPGTQMLFGSHGLQRPIPDANDGTEEENDHLYGFGGNSLLNF